MMVMKEVFCQHQDSRSRTAAAENRCSVSEMFPFGPSTPATAEILSCSESYVVVLDLVKGRTGSTISFCLLFTNMKLS